LVSLADNRLPKTVISYNASNQHTEGKNMKRFFSIWIALSLMFCLFIAPYAAASTVSYTYDEAGRLIKADYGDGKTIEYTYDNAGNLLQKTITGQQAPGQVTLTVQKAGDGTGTVTSSPAGIDCGADCTQDYDQNTQVTLTANPDTGSTFAGWSGDGCSGTDTCTVTMDTDTTVTATFNQSGDDGGGGGGGGGGGTCFIDATAYGFFQGP
jgi:YD repeat-containing protein